MIKELEALEKIWNYLLDNKIDEAEKQYKIVEQTLKRNEPMKVIKVDDDYVCNNCKTYVHTSDQINDLPNYCMNCGKKLDWSDENE